MDASIYFRLGENEFSLTLHYPTVKSQLFALTVDGPSHAGSTYCPNCYQALQTVLLCLSAKIVGKTVNFSKRKQNKTY
jgi:hypothetical protein